MGDYQNWGIETKVKCLVSTILDCYSINDLGELPSETVLPSEVMREYERFQIYCNKNFVNTCK